MLQEEESYHHVEIDSYRTMEDSLASSLDCEHHHDGLKHQTVKVPCHAYVDSLGHLVVLNCRAEVGMVEFLRAYAEQHPCAH